ncbi:hypothetical protein KBY97_05375 [Synechococcus sp. ATX 2A4]|uniref:hypothetical protein n=1 Tax=Synechococcus sp. ATX 2A4 TaxID=2823727 RepID=UPI0020CED689|nr:hypothetical protein [Synechococcus sp. ATX 2A4]MCP9884555.1 hypothetical protein [Synechococcus sp. ATX 2A4]
MPSPSQQILDGGRLRRSAYLLLGALAGLLGTTLLLTGSAPAGPSQPPLKGLLEVGWSIEAADSHLRRTGWSPAPVRQPDALDRLRAGTRLSSLSDCSGTGLGFCRYDYRRGAVNLSVITLPEQAMLELIEPQQPATTNGARVVRWLQADSERSWGLCASSSAPNRLVPCPDQ